MGIAIQNKILKCWFMAKIGAQIWYIMGYYIPGIVIFLRFLWSILVIPKPSLYPIYSKPSD